jgi:DnaK suppressor protein
VDEARARTLLERERSRIEAEIEHHLGRSEDSELSDVDQHMADDATNLYEDELDEGIVEQLREQLAAIERAEKRLQDGTYGKSIDSGEPIPDARLEAVPWAERTVEEQARLGG